MDVFMEERVQYPAKKLIGPLGKAILLSVCPRCFFTAYRFSFLLNVLVLVTFPIKVSYVNNVFCPYNLHCRAKILSWDVHHWYTVNGSIYKT